MRVMEPYLKPQIEQPHGVIGSKQSSNQAFRIGNTIDVEMIDQVEIHILPFGMDRCLEEHVVSGLLLVRAGTSFRLLRISGCS